MSKLIKNIIGKIKDEKIKPTPRWVFLLKRSVILGFFIISVILGGIAISIILYQLKDADWGIYSKGDKDMLSFIITGLPYFWIILMAGFLALAYYNFRHTKAGYKYNVFAIFGLSVFISATLGVMLYLGGVSGKIENKFYCIPHYEKLHYGKRVLWHRPDKGFLSGTIVQFRNGHFITIQDLNRHSWLVNIEGITAVPSHDLRERAMVKIIGEMMNQNRFRARIVTPWHRFDFTQNCPE